MKPLMLAHVFSAAGFVSHSWTAASNSPVAFKLNKATSLRSFKSELIPALVSSHIAFSTLIK
jgi:hypothetical protein